jgi:hypothetical protein
MEQTDQFPKPQKPFSKMNLDELDNLSQDHQRVLALKATLKNMKNIEVIKNNVLFFFWLVIASFIVSVIVSISTIN